MKPFLILITFVTCLANAQVEVQKTLELKNETITDEVAKEFLVHQAVLETLVDKEKELAIEAELFKNKLNEKFAVHFETYRNRKLQEKFGKNYLKDLSPEEKAIFLKSLDSQKDIEFVKHAKLKNLLDSYAVQFIEKPSKTSGLWKAQVALNLNHQKVLLYSHRLTSNANKLYAALRIVPEVNLIGFSWNDLALEKSQSFTEPLLTSWLKYIDSRLPENTEEVLPCKDACLEDFSQWLLIAQEEGMVIPENLLDGLWLRVSYNLRRLYVSSLKEDWAFEWDGSVVVLDANTKRSLFSYTIALSKKNWQGLDQKSLNSALVSALYHSSLDGLARASRKIQESAKLNRLNRLVIQGHQHLGDVFSLIELLKRAGQKQFLELSLDRFDRSEAELLCFYQGEEKSFTDVLSGVKELKSSHSYRVVNESNGVHQVLKLMAE